MVAKLIEIFQPDSPGLPLIIPSHMLTGIRSLKVRKNFYRLTLVVH
jgi:hypothetical protein